MSVTFRDYIRKPRHLYTLPMSHRLHACTVAAVIIAASGGAMATVRDMKLPTAEDGEVVYRVDNVAKQAMNAKDDRAETLPVSTIFLPRTSAGLPKWTFLYKVRFAPGVKPVSIRIETENAKPVTLAIDDRNPRLKDGVWEGTIAPPLEFNRAWAEKIAAKDAWMLQRRYTIAYADGRKSILHQLSILTSERRAEMLQTMAR